MSKKNWHLAAVPLVLGSLGLSAYGCDAAGDLCCTEFTAGADLSNVDFGVEGEAGIEYKAFLQASADFTGAASAAVSDVTNACQSIAVELGGDPNAVTATDPDERVRQWCAQAVAQIEANITAQGSLSISVQPARCTVNASVQGNCEASCTAKAECQVTPAEIVARCEPGELSGKCDAQCTGSCEGSANLAVACEGTCQGTCDGECSGTCEGSAGNGGGNTQCEGKCNGTCKGECRGSCQIEAGANVECNADCSGGCSVEYKAPKCNAELTPPKAECQASADCQGSCNASASAKAECKPPSVEIVATGNINASAIGTLKLHLPQILGVFQARGQLLVKNAEAVVNIGANVSGRAPDLSVKAAACAIPAVNAIGEAAANVKASFEASASVAGALNIGG